jgi:hypothetical protein
LFVFFYCRRVLVEKLRHGESERVLVQHGIPIAKVKVYSVAAVLAFSQNWQGQPFFLEAVTEKGKALFALFSLRLLIPLKGGLKRVQRPENSNLFCCFLAWRLAGYIIHGAVIKTALSL